MSARVVSHRGRPPERPRDRGRQRPSDRHGEGQSSSVHRGGNQTTNLKHASTAADASKSATTAGVGVAAFSSSSSPASSSASAPVSASVSASVSTSSHGNGVAVVCVIGHREEDASQLIDRLLDAQIFGSRSGVQNVMANFAEMWGSGLPKEVLESPFAKEEWTAGLFQHYYNEEQGIVYIQLVTGIDADLVRQYSRSRHGNDPFLNKQNEQGPGLDTGHLAQTIGDAIERGSQRGREVKNDERWEARRTYRGSVRSEIWKRGETEEEGSGHVNVKGTTGIGYVVQEDDVPVKEPLDFVERREGEVLRALLLAFCASHVVIWIQEHARFYPPLLRTLRLLQAAKHALGPSFKGNTQPGILPPPAVPSRGGRGAGGRGGGGRHSSTSNSPANAVESGNSLPTVLLPGHFSPVLLFVHPDDYVEGGTKGSDVAEGETSNCRSSLSRQPGPRRSGGEGGSGEGGKVWRTTMASGSSTGKGGSTSGKQGNALTAVLRKKAQSSLESHIRFLVKKYRVLGYGEGQGNSGISYGSSHRGPNSGGPINSNSGGALFTLDPSRVVVFLDRYNNRPGAALEALSDRLEEVFSRGFSAENQISEGMEGHGIWSVGPGEDIEALREFIWRQTEALRGRGISSQSVPIGLGGSPSSTAQAVASAMAGMSHGGGGGERGSGKVAINPMPELPSLSAWTNACRTLSESLSLERVRDNEGGGGSGLRRSHATGFVVRGGGKAGNGNGIPMSETYGAPGGIENSEDEIASRGKGLRRGMPSRGVGRGVGGGGGGGRGGDPPTSKKSRSSAAVNSAMAFLEGATDINFKFSANWCQKNLPSAIEVYARNLPDVYTTAVHNDHLENALKYFKSKTRGRALEIFSEQLETECEKIWQSGRQRCDAVSLSLRPCVHKLHSGSLPEPVIKSSLGSTTSISKKKVEPDLVLRTTSEAIGSEQSQLFDELKDGGTGSTLVLSLQRSGKKQWVKKAFQEREIGHSSGAVFFHACGCGKSRRIREDPFDFETANSNSFNFPECDHSMMQLVYPEKDGKNLMLPLTEVNLKTFSKETVGQGLVEKSNPNAKLLTNRPTISHVYGSNGLPLVETSIEQPSLLGKNAWSLLRLGDGNFYDSKIGLQQDGFLTGENFFCPVEVTLPRIEDKINSLDQKNSVFDTLKVSHMLTEAFQKFNSMTAKSGSEETPSVGGGKKGGESGVSMSPVGGDLGRGPENDERGRGRGGGGNGGRGGKPSPSLGSKRGEGSEVQQETGGGKKEQSWVLARRPSHNQVPEGRGTLQIKVPLKQETGPQQSEGGSEKSSSRDEAFPPLPQRQVGGKSSGSGGRGLWQGGSGGGQGGVERRGSQGRAGKWEKGDGSGSNHGEQGKGEEESSGREDFPPLPTVPRPGIIRLPINQKKVVQEPDQIVQIGEKEMEEGTRHEPLEEESVGLQEGGSEEMEMEEVLLWLGLEHECPRGHRSIWRPYFGEGEKKGRGVSDSGHITSGYSVGESGEEGESGISRHQKPRASVSLDTDLGRRTDHGIYGQKGGGGGRGMGRGRTRVEEGAKKQMKSISVREERLPQVGGGGIDSLQEGHVEIKGEGLWVLGSDVPIFKECTHCKKGRQEMYDGGLEDGKFYAGTISQLQRIFLVTPSHPISFATLPLVEFAISQETSTVDPASSQYGQKGGGQQSIVQFSPPSDTVLPPNSTLVLRLPFFYANREADGTVRPLLCDAELPDLCARLVPWSAVRIAENYGKGRGVANGTSAGA